VKPGQQISQKFCFEAAWRTEITQRTDRPGSGKLRNAILGRSELEWFGIGGGRGKVEGEKRGKRGKRG